MIKDLEHIWLNLPKNDHHFGYKQKFIKENTEIPKCEEMKPIKDKVMIISLQN
jgi:hypothetical protein